MKPIIWNDSTTSKEVQKRYKNAQDSRKQEEDRWTRNERSIFTGSNTSFSNSSTLESAFSMGLPSVDNGISDMNVAYTFKNFRFIHAQMSSNPPSVVMRPQSSDVEDHRKADAADRVVRYSIRHYSMQENMDQMSLQALLYGTGCMKTVWDSTKGAILSFDKESGEMQLEGDIDVSIPHIRNIHIDPDARNIGDIKWAIERVFIDYDEAKMRWPEKVELLEKSKVTRTVSVDSNSPINEDYYNAVELLEYWETGLPTNAYLGRYCMTTVSGDVIVPCRPSPFRFKKAGAVYEIEMGDYPDDRKEALIEKLPEQAALPYHFLTDIDVPARVWGRSFLEYTAHLQDSLSQLDTSRLENLRAHSVARMVIPESADLADDGISDSPWDVVKISGNQPPYFMQAPAIMPDTSPMRTDLVNGINDVAGVNEAMFGQQSREQAAAAMQYATNQGNMIRRRLFNKYVLVTESIYRAILNLCRKHWSITRTIHVLGKEKALEATDVKGTDIDGGYDVVGEYGVSLSLDPMSRRQEVISMQPLFEKAGVPPRTTLRMMKLSELEGMYDSLDMAGNRQKEIFDTMIATNQYIPPKKFRDHANMIAWAMEYFMSSEFNNLSEEVQLLCEKHIEDRARLAAMEMAPSGGAPTAVPPPSEAPAPPAPTPEGVPQ